MKTSRAWKRFIGTQVYVDGITQEWNGERYVDIDLSGVITNARNYTDDNGAVGTYVTFDNVKMSSTYAKHLDRKSYMDGHTFCVTTKSFRYNEEDVSKENMNKEKLIDDFIAKINPSDPIKLKDIILQCL